jgi:Terminase RNaseH-like domain/Terminase large subunit, T4likevirus-type, N-terminal
MKDIHLALPQPHAGQAQVINESKRFNCLCAGRRFGKSKLGQDRLIHAMLQSKPTAWFSPSYKSSSDAWRELQDLLQPIVTDTNAQERRLVIRGGGSLEVWSLDDADAGRGRAYGAVVLDEAAQVMNLQHAWEQSIRPMLSDYSGLAWFLSTPCGVSSYFHTLFLKGQNQDSNWASWQLPTSANPFIPAGEIEAMRADMSELAFRQEVLAEFVSHEGAVFRKISEAILTTPPTGKPAVIACDWARSAGGDFTCFLVLSDAGEVLEIDRHRGAEYAVQRDRLRALWERHGQPPVVSEKNSMGGVLNEQLRRDGIPVQDWITSNASKAEAVGALQIAFERGEVHIPDDAILIGELSSYQGRPLAGGLMSYGAPEGGHDDMVTALWIAWRSLGNVNRNPWASWEGVDDMFGLSSLKKPASECWSDGLSSPAHGNPDARETPLDIGGPYGGARWPN